MEKSPEDEASPESSQMCTVLAGPLSLPEDPFTAKTIAYILKRNSEYFSALIIQIALHILILKTSIYFLNMFMLIPERKGEE